MSGLSFTLPYLSYVGTLFKLARDPLYMGLEEPSLAFSILMKKLSIHQLQQTAVPFISTGEKMGPQMRPLNSIVEMDQCMAYSHHLAKIDMPTGSPLIYSTSEGNANNVLSRSGKAPHTRGEFRLIYACIQQWMQNPEVDIHHVYHGWSPNGNFKVERFTLDLFDCVFHQRPGAATREFAVCTLSLSSQFHSLL